MAPKTIMRRRFDVFYIHNESRKLIFHKIYYYILVHTYAKLVSRLLGTRNNVESLINTEIEGISHERKIHTSELK